MAAQKRLRVHAVLPVHVVEDHHEVLPIVGRAIGARYLPTAGTTVVHLDAHSDLQLPPTVAADADWETLCAGVDIGDFLLPLAHRGYLGRVVWVRPPWALPELDEGHHVFRVGPLAGHPHGPLRATLPARLYRDERCFAPADALDAAAAADVVVDVHTWRPPPSGSLEGGPPPHDVRAPWWLDVDLDCFATANPFAAEFAATLGAAAWTAFAAPFRALTALGDAAAAGERTWETHEAAQTALEAFLDAALADPAAAAAARAPAAWTDCVPWTADDHAAWMAALAAVRTVAPASGWSAAWLMRAGLQWDQPSHASDDATIAALLAALRQWLTRMAAEPPVLVTVARSAEDGYTPGEHVDALQARVIELVRSVYRDVDVRV